MLHIVFLLEYRKGVSNRQKRIIESANTSPYSGGRRKICNDECASRALTSYKKRIEEALSLCVLSHFGQNMPTVCTQVATSL